MDHPTHASTLQLQLSLNVRRISIENVVQDVQQETLQLRSFLFSRAPLPRVNSFAFDLALVALSIRVYGLLHLSGCLVDAFLPKDPCRGFSALLYRLKQKSNLLRDVVHVYEPCSEQSFLINPLRLLARYPIEDVANSQLTEWPFSLPIFVSTNSPPEVLYTPPEGLFAIVQDLILQISNPSSTLNQSSTIILPQGLSASLTVPLAAILLEYPVAYCPSATIGSPFLTSVTLDVYEVRLMLNSEDVDTSSQRKPTPSPEDEERDHRSVLKFSCPSGLGHSSPNLSHQTIKEQLQSCFDHRLANFLHRDLSVHHTIETLDRVAL
ncbi:hypothetical protein F5050DRAFT_1807297 [Lentinula boryana]|uniref:Uncharacterized protein n=1 Tax=Lentinula boryana TaxID=40481 RepID=A0ABQ8QEE8_9AGAR|nr:hypothetical protein F5050DRAFT_1807297 [Lentinula boryana]